MPKVTLIARPSFLGASECERCRGDQLLGTDGEKLAEFAGRLCYDSFGKGRSSEEFHANIIDHGHVNVLYHAHYSMLIQDVSRNLTHELIRHHVGFSPSQRSTRYCDESDSDVVDHPEVKKAIAKTPGGGALYEAVTTLDKTWRRTYAIVVHELMSCGSDKKTAHGAAARYLPNGIATELVWTGNAQAFRSLIERRSIPDIVDAEFVELAEKMREIMAEEMPLYFARRDSND
jgi:thymidylate synthase (FAD)